MVETIADFDGRIAKVQGAARSGKTEALVQRCTHLIQSGTAPQSILVSVSSALAAQMFRRRLRTALGASQEDAANSVCIQTALDTCIAVLETPAARKATGRVPRILNNAEYNFFLEDMKTLGQPIRRLRKMLSYFYQQMSALEPRETWLLGGEEETVLAHAERVLTLRDAMLVQEAPALCAEFLKSDAGAQTRGSFAYVLCDDFQNISHAEQTSLCLLAHQQLIVCGNPNECQSLRTNHPHNEGFTQFEITRRGVKVFALSGAFGNPAITAYVDGLCDQKAMDPAFKATSTIAIAPSPDDGIMSVKWTTPEDEIRGITKYLRVIMDATNDAHESRTCVLVPNKRWARLAEKVLEQRGFSVSSAGAFTNLSGDPRDTARAQALVAYTKLNLLANPYDMTAWRSWCGFDNFLTNSDAWNGLQDFADSKKLSLYDALAEVAASPEEPFLRSSVLAEHFTQGKSFIAQNADRKGFALLHAIGADGLPEFAELERSLVGDEDAAELFRIECSNVTDPTMPEDSHVLHVAAYGALCGAEYDTILAIAAVDGFMPRRDAFEVISTEEDREHIMAAERKLFYSSVAKANKRLVVSYFTKSDLELAERTKMQVIRVKAEDGERVAVVRPTTFLAEAGNACPATTGGQALLAELGLN